MDDARRGAAKVLATMAETIRQELQTGPIAAAVDLRIGQLVDVPNCIVSAVLPLDIFVD